MIPTTMQFHRKWREFFHKYDHHLDDDVRHAYELDCLDGIWPPKEESLSDLDV